MNFKQLTPEQFTKFATHHPNKSFFQTEQIAELRKSNGWTPYYLGVEKSKKLVAATMLVLKPSFLGYKIAYAPGGPLIDYKDQPLLAFFIKNLKSFLKQKKAYVLHIDPYYELIERDRKGKIVENGFNHEQAAKNLKSLGFKPLEISEQPKYLFALDLNNRTPEELLASFKTNTRGHIKKAEKAGVTVRELKRSELSRLKNITEQTSARRHFTDKPLSYYEKMYDLFSPNNQIKFLLAEAEIDKKPTDLSAAMFLTYGDEIIYLFSGSDERYMRDYNAQYAIQWAIIKYAAKNSYKRYNFYGIQGLPDPTSPDYGVYNFKKGFGGRVIELLGSYELPLSPVYHLHNTLSRLKHLIKK